MQSVTSETKGKEVSSEEKVLCDKRWLLLRFFFCWLACCVTPICIGIVQDVNKPDPFVQLGLACDVFFCIDVIQQSALLPKIVALVRKRLLRLHCVAKKRNLRRKTARRGVVLGSHVSPFSPSNTNKEDKTVLASSVTFVVPTLTASLPLLLPVLARMMGAARLLQAWLTLPRVIRLRDLMNIYHNLKTNFVYFAALRNDTINRCFLTAIFTSFYSSTLAAAWFYLSCRRQHECGDDDSHDSWVGKDEVLIERDTLSIYIRSMHFIIQTLFTVGYGDISIVTNKEFVFSLFLILNGSLYYAFLISAITSFLSNKDVATKMFRGDMAHIQSLLQLRGVPDGLQQRINQLLQFSLTQQRGCNEKIFLEDIPKPLLRDIKLTYTAQLQQLPFFTSLSLHFIELCVERLAYRTYVPGSVVYFQNERRREVLLIKTGKIELKVHTAKGALFTCMAGDSIGDFQLIFGNPSEVTAQASTFTEVMVLSLASFTEAIQVHNLGSKLTVDQWLAEQREALQATIDSHRKHLVKFVKTRQTIEVTRKNKRMLDMMEDIHTVHSAWVVLPESRIRPLWSAISLIGIAYFVFAIPFRILSYSKCSASSMKVCLSSWDHSLIVDYAWDIFFVADLVLNCFFFAFKIYENDQHVLITNKRLIFNRFWQSQVSVKYILPMLPLDFLSLSWGYLLCLRLPKLLWTFELFSRLDVILYYHEHYSVKKQALLSTEGITVIHLAIVTFLVMLWTAVCWTLLRMESDGEGFVAGLYWTMTTMTTVGYGDIVPLTNFETLFTVTFCVIGPSCCAAIIAIAASFFNSTDVSVDNISHRQVVVKSFMGTVLPEIDQSQGRRKSSLLRLENKSSFIGASNSVRKYSFEKSNCRVYPVDSALDVVNEDDTAKPMSTQVGPGRGRRSSQFTLIPASVPEKSPFSLGGNSLYRSLSSSSSFNGISTLRNNKNDDDFLGSKRAQVLAYLEHVARERNGLDENKLISLLLPDYMQEDLQQAKVMEVVLSSNFFSKCNSGFLRDAMLAMEVHFVPQNAKILHAGSVVSGIYIVLNGIVQIYTAQGRKNQKLTVGEAFSEIFLLEEGTCNFRVEAHTDCEVVLLRRIRFQKLVREHGATAMKVPLEHMEKVAKLASKKITSTPQPSVRCLLAGKEQKRLNSTGKYYVDPKSMQYLCWISLLMIITMLNVLFLPARLAFMEDMWDFWSSFVVFDYASDVCFIADIVMRLQFLVFYDQQGPVYSREEILERYAEGGYMYIHLMAAIPLDIVLIAGGKTMGPIGLSYQQAIAASRINKLLRCVDLVAHSALVEDKLSKYFSESFKLMLRVCKMILAVMVLAHIFGCIFFIVGNQQHLRGDKNNWADDAAILRNCSLGSMGIESRYKCAESPELADIMTRYIFSIYWATATLTTVGFGDISAVNGLEQTFAMVVFLVGTAAYTVIVTNLEDIVSHMDVTSDIFKGRKTRVQNFLHRERVPEEYLRRSAMHLEKLWLTQKGSQGGEIKGFLPRHVYADIVMSSLKGKMKRMHFLKNQSTDFLTDVAASMVFHTFMASDTIFQTGEAADLLFLISTGEISMVSDATGHLYAKLYAGECSRLGSSEFFLRQIYMCTAQASSDVALFALTFPDFWEIVEHHRQEDTFLRMQQTEVGISGSLTKDSTHQLVQKFSSNLNKNSKMSQMMRMSSVKGLKICPESYYIPPDSWLQNIWSIASILFIVYISLTVPYLLAFREVVLTIAVMDSILFAFYAVDMFFRVRLFAIELDGEILVDRNDFSSVYFSEKFKWDLCSTFPIALIVLATSGNVTMFAVARSLYLIRLPRCNGHLQDILRMLSALSPKVFSISPEKLRVGKVVACVCYLAHVTCCAMCLIGVGARARGEENWIEANDYDHLSSLSIYLRAYFWAIYTIVTVGFGSVSVVSSTEKVFAMSVMILGAIMCDAGITAMLTSIIANADKLSGTMRRSEEGMLQFCRSHRYSEDIQGKVALYYDYVSNKMQNSFEAQDFNLLSLPLKFEFVQHFAFDSLCSLCLLDTEDTDIRLGFVYSLLRHAELTIAIPGQVILAVDGLDIHILRRGKAYARSANQKGGLALRRNYFQEGEALCREGRLNTTAAMSPGKLVTVTLRSLEDTHFTNRRPTERRLGSVRNLYNDDSSVSESPKGSVRGFMSARRMSITHRGSGLERYLGRSASVAAKQFSSVYARISCGARKKYAARKPFTATSSPKGWVNAVTWDEDFTFHVPQAAPNLKISFFDDKDTEENGCLGKVVIDFAEMDRMPAYRKSVVKDDTDDSDSDISSIDDGVGEPSRASTEEESGAGGSCMEVHNDGINRNCTGTKPVGDSKPLPPDEQSSFEGGNFCESKQLDRCDSLPCASGRIRREAFRDSATHGVDDEIEKEDSSDVYIYRFKQDVRDKRDQLRGVADFDITVRGAGIADYPGRKKAKVAAHLRQLSCTPTEVVAESFCHLVTIPNEKLMDLRAFYGEYLSWSKSQKQGNSSSTTTLPLARNAKCNTSMRNFTSFAYASTRSSMGATSARNRNNKEGSTLQIERMDTCDSISSAGSGLSREGRRRSVTSLTNNQLLRKLSCAAIASDSLDDTQKLNLTPTEKFRRHSVLKLDRQQEAEPGQCANVRQEKRIRRRSLVLNVPPTQFSSSKGDSANKEEKCTDNDGGGICSMSSEESKHSACCNKELSPGTGINNPVDDGEDGFDSDISDNEMEEAFGLASLAQNLRKDSALDRSGFRLSWV